jgi:PAS domain S-box-containing protein
MPLRDYYRTILETVGDSIVVLDSQGAIDSVNPATIHLWALDRAPTQGTPLQHSPLRNRCPELAAKIEEAKTRRGTVDFKCELLLTGGAEKVLAVRVRPIFSEDQSLAGTIVCAEDVTPRKHLERTIAELESTSRELQSANEELEASHEELQSLNEALETIDDELQIRNQEIDRLNTRYAKTLERLPIPVMLLNEQMKIEFWNSLAQTLFGFKEKPPVQLQLEQLPIPEAARKLFKRKHQKAIEKNGPVVLNAGPLGLRGCESANVHFAPLPQGQTKNVLVMIDWESGSGNSKANDRKVATTTRRPFQRSRSANK